MLNAGLFGSMQSENFFQIKFLIIQAAYPSKLPLPGQLVPPKQFLIQPLFFVQECYFAKDFEVTILNF